MSQKIAFITGGNRGLGFQTALELKDAGVKVVIGSRDLAQGEEAVAKLRAAGVDADVLQFDITKPADHKAAYDYFNSQVRPARHSGQQRRHRRRRVSRHRPRALGRRRSARPAAQGLRDQLLFPGGAHPGAAAAARRRARPAASSTSPAFSPRSPSTPTPRRPSTTPSPSPTTPPRPRSTPSPSTLPMNCATPKSRSTPRIPAGSRPTWAARMPPWN